MVTPTGRVAFSAYSLSVTSVYNRDQGLLRLRPDHALVEEARRDAEREITSTTQENVILDHARNNAEESIRALVTTLGFEEIEFVR